MTEKLPRIYVEGRELVVKLDGPASAALATYRREMHPGRSDEAVAAYLIRDALVHLGVMELPRADRGRSAGRKATPPRGA